MHDSIDVTPDRDTAGVADRPDRREQFVRWVREECLRGWARHWPVAGELVTAVAAIWLLHSDHRALFIPAICLLLTAVICLSPGGSGAAAAPIHAGRWSALLVGSAIYSAVTGRVGYETIGAAAALAATLGLIAVTLRRHEALLGALRDASYHDLLTGLPNRRQLQDRLDQALGDARRQGQVVGILYLDLDGFKAINDTLGHAVGDEALRQVAGRLARRIRDGDTLARVGGDEFVCVLTNIVHSSAAAIVARSLTQALQEPFLLQGRSWRISASIGISVYPADGQDSRQLLQQADAAMYEVKHRAKGTSGYLRGVPVQSQEDRLLDSTLSPGPEHADAPFGKESHRA